MLVALFALQRASTVDKLLNSFIFFSSLGQFIMFNMSQAFALWFMYKIVSCHLLWAVDISSMDCRKNCSSSSPISIGLPTLSLQRLTLFCLSNESVTLFAAYLTLFSEDFSSFQTSQFTSSFLSSNWRKDSSQPDRCFNSQVSCFFSRAVWWIANLRQEV